MLSDDIRTYEEMVDRAIAIGRAEELAGKTGTLVVVAGIPFAQAGTTNNLRVIHMDGKA